MELDRACFYFGHGCARSIQNSNMSSVSPKSCQVTLRITLASCGDLSTIPIRLDGIHGPEQWAIAASQACRV